MVPFLAVFPAGKSPQALCVIQVIFRVLYLFDVVAVQSSRFLQKLHALFIGAGYGKGHLQYLIKIYFLELKVKSDLFRPAVWQEAVDLSVVAAEHKYQRVLELTEFNPVKIPVYVLAERSSVAAFIRPHGIKRLKPHGILCRKRLVFHTRRHF